MKGGNEGAADLILSTASGVRIPAMGRVSDK